MTAQVYITFYTILLHWHFNKTLLKDFEGCMLFLKTLQAMEMKLKDSKTYSDFWRPDNNKNNGQIAPI